MSTQALQDDPSEAAASDRRRHKRKPVLWAARVEASGRAADCIILDLPTLGGGRLRGIAPRSRRSRR